MGFVMQIDRKSFWKRWKHKLFSCPTFWKLKPAFTCPICGREYRCYWDGHDEFGKVNVCTPCYEKGTKKIGDKMAQLVPIQSEFMQDVALLLTFISVTDFIVTGGEIYRSKEQQEIHIKFGRSTTYNSKHLKRLAIDLNFFKKGKSGKWMYTVSKKKLQKFGDYWESLHPKNTWGGNWKSPVDTPHFQRSM